MPELEPYCSAETLCETIDRLHDGSAVVDPQDVLSRLRRELPKFEQFNGWLADHIVGYAGTMAFFYLLMITIGGWGIWQGAVLGNHGFDPYPFSFLFFILGGIMQSLFVPTSLTAANRAAMRDRLKDEADHRANEHLYEVNEEQLAILRELSVQLALLNGRGTDAAGYGEPSGEPAAIPVASVQPARVGGD
jgi:uncharacterized membrane protein